MAVRCSNCGREFDISLFQFGKRVVCECKNIVEFKGWQRPDLRKRRRFVRKKGGRMLKGFFWFLAFCLILVNLSYTQDFNYLENSLDKLQQGIINSLTGWLEIPFQIAKGYKYGVGEEGKAKFIGAFLGIFRGVIHSLGRTTSGMLQLLTFPLPNPKDNHNIGIPLDSEYVWEEGRQYFLLKEGLEPIGNKIIRGSYNAFLGILDMPAQLIKGFNQDKPFVGIYNSIAFPISRIIYGVSDLATFILPNSSQTYGYPWEEKYPWDAFSMEKYYNQLYKEVKP